MVVQRGYRQAANYHIDRLRKMPVGYFVDVMTNGFGVMPDYRSQIPADDRWRIAAYVRALQLSHAADGRRRAGRRTGQAEGRRARAVRRRRRRAAGGGGNGTSERARDRIHVESRRGRAHDAADRRPRTAAHAARSAWRPSASPPPRAGYLVAREAFWQSYLIAYIFWIGITLGSLGILMIQHLTGGAWTHGRPGGCSRRRRARCR